VFHDERRPDSGTGRSWRAVSSAAVAAVLALVSLTACSKDSESSTSPDSSAPTTPAETTGAPEQSIDDSLYFYPPVEGATLRYEVGGLAPGTVDVTVNSVTSGADGQTVAATQVVTAQGESVTVEQTVRTGADGSLSLDAATFFASGTGFTVTGVGDAIVIPPVADLEAGRESSGSTFVEMESAGLSMRNDVTYTVRGAGYESVTVPAGTTEAYVVEIQLDITSSVVGAQSGSGRYWLVPGFGLVRQEFAIAMINNSMELVSSSVPLP
jgi:hypothetical protein